MPADKHITVAAGRRRQTAVVVRGNRMNSSAHVLIEHISFTEPGFVLGRQSIAIPETHGWVVTELVVPVTCNVPGMVIKPRMILSVLIVPMRIRSILVVASLLVRALTLVVSVLVLPMVLGARNCTE